MRKFLEKNKAVLLLDPRRKIGQSNDVIYDHGSFYRPTSKNFSLLLMLTIWGYINIKSLNKEFFSFIVPIF